MNILKKQLLPLCLLLNATTCLAANTGGIQMPQAIVSLKERIEKDVKKRLQSEAEKGVLYSLDALPRYPNFQHASNSQKQELSLEHFKNKKDSFIRNTLFPYLTKQAIILAVVVTLTIVLFLGVGKVKKIVKNIMRENMHGNDLEGLDMLVEMYINGIAVAIIMSFLGFILKVGSDAWTLLRFYIDPKELYNPMLSSLQERYIRLKWRLIKDGRNDYIKVIESGLINLGIDNKQYHLVTQITELLDLAKIVDDKGNFLIFDEERIDEFLIGIKPHIAKRIKEELFSMVVMVNIAKLRGLRTQYTLLLYGPPGTGKTRLAKGLAELINLYCFYVNMSSGVQGIFGIQKQKSSNLTQGIASGMSHDHAKYPVAIFDDVDRDMINQPMSTSWQLEILDNSKHYYRDAFFNVNIPKPMIMIFTGNHADKLDKAAENRFSATIHFDDPFTNQGKHMALDDELDSLIEKHKGLPYSITKKDYTKNEWQRVKENAIKEAALKKDQGLRECLKYVRHYFNKKVKKKHDAILKKMKMNNQKHQQVAAAA